MSFIGEIEQRQAERPIHELLAMRMTPKSEKTGTANG
jgi:hypothetical protein